MKVSCTKENLLRGLTSVSHIAGKNITLPILNNVLLKATGGTLELSATNLELATISKVRGKVEQEGSFTVQAKLLTDYVTLLPNERIDFELRENALHIHCANNTTVMHGMEASEFPLIPTVEKRHQYVCNAQEFRAALGQIVFAVSNDESRPEISGALFSVKAKKLTLASTDSYRLAERSMPLESSTDDTTVIVPAKTIYELLRVMDADEQKITVVLSDNQMLFVLSNAELISRTIEGRYPDYAQIIPKSHTTQIRFNVEELTKAVRTTSLFCKTGINDITLQFFPDKKMIAISALNSQVGESTTTVQAQVSGKPNDIILNYRYLLDGLANIGTQEAEFSMEDNASPGMLAPKDGSDYLYIIMPIKQ